MMPINQSHEFRYNLYKVECTECYLSTPWYHSKEEAEKSWNRRA